MLVDIDFLEGTERKRIVPNKCRSTNQTRFNVSEAYY